MRRAKVLIPVLLTALALPAMALAGHPAPGATYTGKSVKDDQVLLRVSRSGHQMFIRVIDPCGTKLKGTGLTIGGKGRFDAVSSSGAEVKGSFVSRRKATGTVENQCNGLGRRDFVATRR
jgi:hypothetical protein